MAAWQPGLIVFVFKQAAEAATGASVEPGSGPRFEGRPTFLLPSPYADREAADAVYAALADWERRLHVFNA